MRARNNRARWFLSERPNFLEFRRDAPKLDGTDFESLIDEHIAYRRRPRLQNGTIGFLFGRQMVDCIMFEKIIHREYARAV